MEVMLRFYEFFDPSEYQNTERLVSTVTVIEEKEIKEGHYEQKKFEDSDQVTASEKVDSPSTNQEPLAK